MTTPQTKAGRASEFDARRTAQLFRRPLLPARATASTRSLRYVLLVAAMMAPGAGAQQDMQPPPVSSGAHPATGGARGEAPDPIGLHMEHQMAERRNDDRQKQLVADTDKLLSLAQALKAEVDKSNKDQLSLDVVKRAEQIEKLAKSVKEKMKGY